MYTLKEKKLVYTSLLNNISSAACSRQLHCHSKCSFPSHAGFSVSFCIFISVVLEHLQTSIYTWHSHRAWLHFIFTFQKWNHLQFRAKLVLALICFTLRTSTVNNECWDNVTSYEMSKVNGKAESDRSDNKKRDSSEYMQSISYIYFEISFVLIAPTSKNTFQINLLYSKSNNILLSLIKTKIKCCLQ